MILPPFPKSHSPSLRTGAAVESTACSQHIHQCPSASQSCDLNPFSKLLSHSSLSDSQFFSRPDDYAELALFRAVDPWRRRSQRAVLANNRSGRKTARPKRRVRGANHPRRNSRPAPLEGLGPRLSRHRRILRPQINCFRRTEISRAQEPIPFQWTLRSP
jgi:hypothetical protein